MSSGKTIEAKNILKRRDRLLGNAYRLFYEDPIHISWKNIMIGRALSASQYVIKLNFFTLSTGIVASSRSNSLYLPIRIY